MASSRPAPPSWCTAVPPTLHDEAFRELREAFDDIEEGEAFPAENLSHLVEQRHLTRLDRAPFLLGLAARGRSPDVRAAPHARFGR
jgi:hypothetical protein